MTDADLSGDILLSELALTTSGSELLTE